MARRAQTVAASGANGMALRSGPWVRAAGPLRRGVAVLERCSPRNPDPSALDAERWPSRGPPRRGRRLRRGHRGPGTVLRWQRGGSHPRDHRSVCGVRRGEFRAGDWPAATFHVELGLSLAEDLDQAWHLAYARAVAAQLCAARGDRVAAASMPRGRRRCPAFRSAEARGYRHWHRRTRPGRARTGRASSRRWSRSPRSAGLARRPPNSACGADLRRGVPGRRQGRPPRRLREQSPDRPWGRVLTHTGRGWTRGCAGRRGRGGAERISAAAMPQPTRPWPTAPALDYGMAHRCATPQARRGGAADPRRSSRAWARPGWSRTPTRDLACGVVTPASPARRFGWPADRAGADGGRLVGSG